MKKWRCKVCGYVHEGPEPPEVCPVCGAPRSEFEEVEEAGQTFAAAAPAVGLEARGGAANEALFSLGYGLYVVAARSGDGERVNAQTANTVFQLTSEPPRIALGINKNNLTHQYIQESGQVAVTVLGRGNLDLVKRFGYQSGRNVDKFQGLASSSGPSTGLPVLPQGSAFLEARVSASLDVGTHTLFVAEVLDGGLLKGSEPLSYAAYRQNRNKPEDLLGGDVQNVIATLNLEFAANRRYDYQVGQLSNPRLNAVLEGVMRTEGDHVENALAYLRQKLAAGLGRKGLADAGLFLRLNLDFEETATATYRQFLKEAESEELKATFQEMVQSEAGHVNMFRRALEEINKGEFPVVFYCPVCGWEIDFGSAAQAGDVRRCERCGARFELALDGRNNWTLAKV